MAMTAQPTEVSLDAIHRRVELPSVSEPEGPDYDA